MAISSPANSVPLRQPRCERCGYDLRGLESVKEPRCPECGMPFDPQTLGHWVLPWTKRQMIGQRKAYRRTVWMLLTRQKEIGADALVPLGYEDAQAFCRRSHWLAYLPTAIATCLFYCTLYAQIDPHARWGLHRVKAMPGARGLPILVDPAVIYWAEPWVGLVGLLVLEWLGLKLMPILTALTIDQVAADDVSQAQRHRRTVLWLYNQCVIQIPVSLVALAPVSVLFALRLFRQGDHSVPPALYAFPVFVGIGLGVLYLCSRSGRHIGSGTRAILAWVWAGLLTISLIVYGMLGLRMVVAAAWSSLL